ncbi:hypothetical protein GCM10007424_27180 [Flavobacterium suaedae]|uniref:Lipoprotein n=1 Tax=Flavobacterium suaedae TaxID=1767027 RepID=A0ABQ1K738_9FLAO|nr:hypothetical protein [Flavobacterium suaedae]GGB85673.1 hypothetical protein GCM10007424_27180 [Flavobacterium suaedae]
MKKIALIILASLLTISCNTVKSITGSDKKEGVQYRDDFMAASDAEKKDLLQKLSAEGSNYSVIILTQNYKGQQIIITDTNKKRLYSEYAVTNLGTGIAATLRMDNRLNTTIRDNYTKEETIVEADDAQKHKFIYVKKNPGSKTPYTITYSNTLRPLE